MEQLRNSNSLPITVEAVMTHSGSPTVLVILDPDFGDKLSSVKERGPVWLVKTPRNEHGWRSHQPFAANSALFTAVDPEARLQNLVTALPDIEIHFGEESFPLQPHRLCRVYGLAATDEVVRAVHELGARVLERTDDGFVMDISDIR